MTLTKDQVKKLSDHLSAHYNVLDPSGIVHEMIPEQFVSGIAEHEIDNVLLQSEALYRKIFTYPQDMKQRVFWSKVYDLLSQKNHNKAIH